MGNAAARVTWEETTLEDGKVKRVEYGYDQFNNVTSTKEYDFGTAGAPGSLLRQTFRTFTTALNGYCYSNLSPLDSTCGSLLASDVSSIIYQPRLLLSETVKDADGNQKSFTQFEYDNYTNQPNHAPIFLNSGMVQYDGSLFATFNSGTQPRGNVTKITRWLNGGTDVASYSQYDNAGQVIWSKDPNGNISIISYADNFGVGTNPDPAAGVTGAAGPTFAMASITTNALGHQVKMQYDYSLGAATGVKDANGVITKTEYDTVGRPFRMKTALGLAEQSVSQISHPTVQENAARVSKQLDAVRWLASKTDFDGFDRPIRSWQAEDGQHASLANFSIRADTIYDALGRVKKVSNPYRPAGEIPIYTTTAYDLAGRVVSLTTPDNAVVATIHSGNVVTVSDQMQKQRKSVTDALGRLKEVYEDPNGLNYLTTYGYDALDDLTSVSQGLQARTFVYDSLKRLTSATNPENGTTAYQYDANGNLKQKTDARGVVITYVYDVLNRNTTTDYSDTTAINPDITRIYDTAINGKGRPREMYSGGSETVGTTVETARIQSYDALGRPLDQRQRFKTNGVWSAEFRIQRGYNLAGSITSETYPSGHIVAYTYDGAGRASSFGGNLGDGTQRYYSSEIIYSSLGGMTKEKFGTDAAIYNKLFYNSRGQVAEIRESTSYTGPTDTTWNRGAIINHYSNNCWGMCGGSNSTMSMVDNNGTLKKQEVYIPNNDQLPTTGYQTWWQRYDYDKLNRLQRVREITGNTALDLQQEYVYDRYGNRTIHQTNTWGAGVNKRDFTASATNNRLGVPAGQRGVMTYDAAGNLTADTYSAAAITRTYDAENRMTSETQPNNLLAGIYTYDADGQRVRRKVGGVETWQVYGMDGELLAEYAAAGAAGSPQKEYGYRNGQLLITAAPATDLKWLVTDQLGTPRMVLDKTGALATIKRHDYLPFGEELFAAQGARTTALGYGASDSVRQKFTSYERDNESGLDYAQARYYGNTQGRFTSADPYVIFFEMRAGRNARERSQMLRAYSSEPQNWNRYSYCLNDPMNLFDPYGLVWLTKDNENYQWVDDKKYKAEDWEGYTKVDPGTIAYFGEGWGGYDEKYKNLIGSYVTLNADGSLSSVGVSPADGLGEANGPYTSYSLSYKVVNLGAIIDSNSQVYPTFGIGPSWAIGSYSRTQGQGPVNPGIYLQGSVANYGLGITESINLLHPTSGLSREVGWATPNLGVSIQVVLPALKGTTPRDWDYHPDNPQGKGLMWHPVGRCPY